MASSVTGGARLLGTPRIALNTLKPIRGSRKKKTRVGRGPGSGRGKTSKRGQKGAYARNNSMNAGFAGGQTPIFRTQPKRGFTNPNQKEFEPLNLSTLAAFVARGRLDASKPISMYDLYRAGVVSKPKHGVKLLGKGSSDFNLSIKLEVSRASKSAIEAVEAAGGGIVCKYYNRLNLRALLKPEKFTRIPRHARPWGKDLEWYSNFDNRGYLAMSDEQLKDILGPRAEHYSFPKSPDTPPHALEAAAQAQAAAAEAP